MWNNVIGQARTKHILQSAILSGKLPGAYLFAGPEGTGKDAAAFELAKSLNCLNPKMDGVEACDECSNCISIASLASPVVTFVHALAKDVSSDSAAQKDEEIEVIREQLSAKAADPYFNLDIPRATSIQIGQIRELRLSMSRSLAGGGKRRVIIISEADMMNSQSQNAFLKTLEEPHANTLIILTSSNASRLLPTVLSRCQMVKFDLLLASEIAEALIEREELPQAQADFLARLSGGSYSRAREAIGEDVQEMRNQIVGFLRMGLSKSRRNATLEIDKFLPRAAGGKFLDKRQAVERRLTLLTLWLRDALAISTQSESEIVNFDQKEDLTKFVARLGEPKRIIAAIGAVDRAMHLTKLQLQLRPVMLQLVIELEAALV